MLVGYIYIYIYILASSFSMQSEVAAYYSSKGKILAIPSLL